MLLPTRSHVRPVAHFMLIFLAVVAFATSPLAIAAEPGAEAIQAHLAAGEFGPATKLALALPTGEARDRALGDVAAAQARAGSRSAALATLGNLSADVSRAGAYERIAAQPLVTTPARGGGVQADFETLIELIQSTVAPESWEAVGGKGALSGFEGGVWVDAAGLLRKQPLATVRTEDLAALRSRAAPSAGRANRNVRATAELRMVSLTRLEQQVQMRRTLGRAPDEAMRYLAGLSKIQYVFVYPDSSDVVLAGPAGDWHASAADGRVVSVTSGRPVLQLDDLIVVLRNALREEARFGCSITPVQENLAATKAFLAESAKTPLKPSQRDQWLKELRDTVGKQNIEVYGIDPQTRAARVLVEADYRMKLVGMGLEEGTLGVKSYLDTVRIGPAGTPPPMNVLRWWFTLNYQAVQATPDRQAYELRGPGVQVLSENEMLTQRGERVHTGQSDELNREFAQSFTRQFGALSAKYPVYADLGNIFDLALVAALIKAEDVPGRVDWHFTHFANAEKCPVALAAAPTQVDSVVNHRVLDGKHIVAGVSGGVTVDAWSLVGREAIKTIDDGKLEYRRSRAVPRDLDKSVWWWD